MFGWQAPVALPNTNASGPSDVCAARRESRGSVKSGASSRIMARLARTSGSALAAPMINTRIAIAHETVFIVRRTVAQDIECSIAAIGG